MTDRIGVIICACGQTLQDALDIRRLVQAAEQWPGVAAVQTVPLLCAPDAGGQLAATIRSQRIERVVFAGCSPREHETTFRRILTDAGINPYLMQIANIREQCAWTIHDRETATGKAIDLIRGAVRRVRHHQPLSVREIDCRPDVLVIGAGVAGINAARTLVQHHRRVVVVERTPCIGGRVALYEDLYPDLNCAACLLESDLDDLLHDDRITVLTLAEVTAVRGYAGNFSVVVRQHPRFIDARRCIGCEACLAVCPESCANDFNASMDRRAAIFIPYAGALPHLAAIDPKVCRRFQGTTCSLCQEACPFDAVDYNQTGTTHTFEVGAIVVATGFEGFDPSQDRRFGKGAATDVITALAFERMVNTTGPTAGRIVAASGQPPTSVAVVHCVGSRSGSANAYCSGVCCSHCLKHARQIRDRLPGTMVHLFFADLCLPGKAAQRAFDDLRDSPGIHLHRMARPDAIHLGREAGTPVIHYVTVDGAPAAVEVQFVILATALEAPHGTRELARILDVAVDRDGFFRESHPVTTPVASSRQGIYLAGCCQGPKNIPDSVAQGQAAAGCILQQLLPGGKITLDPMTARVDDDLCSGCRTCVSICPYGAITDDETYGGVTIQEVLCHGCGICAAACPCGAIQVCHYDDAAIAAEIDGLLAAGKVNGP